MKNKIYGLLLSIIIALFSTILGKKFEIIGAPIIAVIIGILINNLISLSEKFRPGIKFSSKYVLQASIVILGFTLNLRQVKEVGLSSLSVTLITISAAYIGAYLLGRLLGVDKDLIALIGSGTAICGGSAIAAVSTVIEPEEHDLAYAMSTIFLFNVIAALIFPPIGHLLGMNDNVFGLWAGTAINDTSSVVAAGYAYSEAAGDFATIVKLSRTIMIIPICFVYSFIKVRKKNPEDMQKNPEINIRKIFPWFILLFLLASVITTFVEPISLLKGYFSESAKFMIAMALGAVGLSTNFRQMFKTGLKPIFLGFCLWLIVSVTSLIVQYFL